MCRVMVKAGKTAVRVIGSFGPLGERLYRWMTAVGQTKRSDWRMNGSATTWIFTYKNIGRPTLAHVRNSIRAYILLWYENCSAIQVSSEESHRYDIELKLCLRKLNILTKRFDTWRWPVIIWTVGGKCHVQWILSKKTIQSCPISFQFKSHLFKMIFFVYHVTFTLPSELSWIRLVHLEHPKSPRCRKFHIESVHFWEWQNILSYFHLNPWLLIVLIGIFSPL